MYYLYRITNLIDNKVYIGQSVKETDRWRQHKYFARQEQPIQYIHHAMKKYGIENFIYEVIVVCKTQNDTNILEKEIIKQYNSRDKQFGYNIAPGGDPAWNRGLPKEQQPMFGKKQSDYQKQRMSEFHTGKKHPHSQKWKDNLSQKMTGRIINNEWRTKISRAQTKFSLKQELEIINEYKSNTSARILSEKYKCSIPTIYNILKRNEK